MTTTKTGTHCGSIEEFCSHRLGKAPNLEQLEAFGREFYYLTLGVVNCRGNAFSLGAKIDFPRLPCPEALDYFVFTNWVVEYFRWIHGLFQFEQETLATARVTWL